MNVRKEIEDYSTEENKPILLWLFNKYHWASQWRFVADCTFTRHGKMSYESHRVWAPTQEGAALYNYNLLVHGQISPS